MLNNYTAAARRNLMRNRLHAAINIAGLAVGFAVAILVALFIRDEQSYDQVWPGHQRIYRLYSMYKFPSDAALHESEGTIADAVSWLKLEFPTIQYATRIATDQRSVLPASGFFIRHARNVEMSNVEVQTVSADARPACWLQNVEGADFFRMRFPAGRAYALDRVAKFRSFGSRSMPDVTFDDLESRTI